jgi:hypothetical protein
MEEQSAQKSEIRRWRRQRLCVSIFCFGAPILVILIFWYYDSLDKIFFLTEKKDCESLYRLLWCGFGSMWGFSAIAFYWRNVRESPFPLYLTYYPFLLLVISLLVFSIMHLFEKTSGYLFYYFSFALCSLLGFQVDQFWKIIDVIFRKAESHLGK